MSIHLVNFMVFENVGQCGSHWQQQSNCARRNLYLSSLWHLFILHLYSMCVCVSDVADGRFSLFFSSPFCSIVKQKFYVKSFGAAVAFFCIYFVSNFNHINGKRARSASMHVCVCVYVRCQLSIRKSFHLNVSKSRKQFLFWCRCCLFSLLTRNAMRNIHYVFTIIKSAEWNTIEENLMFALVKLHVCRRSC